MEKEKEDEKRTKKEKKEEEKNSGALCRFKSRRSLQYRQSEFEQLAGQNASGSRAQVSTYIIDWDSRCQTWNYIRPRI
ncbi:hypothetical protein LTR28_002710, partial [Elasticomyces elasticus]